MKRLADQETEHSKLVIVGINRAGDSLVRHAPDLSNRIDVIKFEVEPRNKIEELIHLGEEALNIDLEAGHQVVEAAQGSFYLAQMLCRELCIEGGVNQQQESYPGPVFILERTLSGDGAPGAAVRPGGCPRVRAGRVPAQRPRAVPLLLKWIADSERWDIALDDEIPKHPEQRGSVGQIVDKGYLENLASRGEHCEGPPLRA